MQVVAVKTPATPGQVVGAFRRAVAAVGHTGYLLPLAQSAFETGNWTSMYSFNSGNVTEPNPSAMPWMYEYSGSLKFKAFTNLDDGVAAQVDVLRRYGALAFADANDVDGYVNNLQANRYIGNDTAAYAALRKSLPSLMAKYASVAAEPPPDAIVLREDITRPLLIAAGIIAAAGGAAWLLRNHRRRLPAWI